MNPESSATFFLSRAMGSSFSRADWIQAIIAVVAFSALLLSLHEKYQSHWYRKEDKAENAKKEEETALSQDLIYLREMDRILCKSIDVRGAFDRIKELAPSAAQLGLAQHSNIRNLVLQAQASRDIDAMITVLKTVKEEVKDAISKTSSPRHGE